MTLRRKENDEFGGAAFEYVVVTAFSAVIAISTVKIVKDMIGTRIANLEKQFEEEHNWLDTNEN